MLGRLLDRFGGRLPTPEQLLAADPEDIRAAGLSRRKVQTCSVPNTVRVAFYGPEFYSFPLVNEWATEIKYVSWRDDRGEPHRGVFVGRSSPSWTSP